MGQMTHLYGVGSGKKRALPIDQDWIGNARFWSCDSHLSGKFERLEHRLENR